MHENKIEDYASGSEVCLSCGLVLCAQLMYHQSIYETQNITQLFEESKQTIQTITIPALENLLLIADRTNLPTHIAHDAYRLFNSDMFASCAHFFKASQQNPETLKPLDFFLKIFQIHKRDTHHVSKHFKNVVPIQQQSQSSITENYLEKYARLCKFTKKEIDQAKQILKTIQDNPNNTSNNPKTTSILALIRVHGMTRANVKKFQEHLTISYTSLYLLNKKLFK